MVDQQAMSLVLQEYKIMCMSGVTMLLSEGLVNLVMQ